MIDFQPTVTLDGLIQVTAFIGGGLFAFFKLRGDVEHLNLRVAHIEKSTDALGETIKSVAVQDNRLLNVENDIRDLRRGRGYIKDND